jgi:hypothetical protein
MTITPDEDVGVGPGVPQTRPQPDQDPGIFRPGRAGARTQGGRDEGMRRPCENEEWQRAMVLRGMIRERQLLRALGRIIGVIKVEHNGGWGLCVAGHELVHQGRSEPRDVLTVHTVFEPRERRGTRSIVGRSQGGAFHPKFAQGVTPQTIGVIGIRLSRGDLIDALGQEVP